MSFIFCRIVTGLMVLGSVIEIKPSFLIQYHLGFREVRVLFVFLLFGSEVCFHSIVNQEISNQFQVNFGLHLFLFRKLSFYNIENVILFILRCSKIFVMLRKSKYFLVPPSNIFPHFNRIVIIQIQILIFWGVRLEREIQTLESNYYILKSQISET